MLDAQDKSPAGLDAEQFFADMISGFAGTLEGTVGLEDASGFVARVGDDMGMRIADLYRDADGVLPADLAAIAGILSDLKGRIGGHFEVEEVTPTRAVLVGHRCPFAERVEGKPSLCMMTTNVFGRIAAEATGYSAVTIERARALGHPACRVIVDLERPQSDAAHEFYR